MSIKASGSPAHPDSFFVVLPPKTTQETTFRGAEYPVESPGVGAGAGRKPTAIYKNNALFFRNIDFACQLSIARAHQLAVAGACRMSPAPTTPSHGVMDAMFGLGEPRVADNDCMNTVVCCCYGIHHLIYYCISM
jgi:hypothetical protein